MKKRCILLIITCVFLFCRCYNRRSNLQEFSIFYFHGEIDTYIKFDCETLDSLSKISQYDDTIFIDVNTAEEIKQAVEKIQHDSNYINTRNAIMHINIGKPDLYLNDTDNNCWIKRDNKYQSAKLSNKIIYLLKWKSMYYNYLSLDKLEEDKGIQMYGLPADFKHCQVDKFTKKKEASKILVKVNYLQCCEETIR